jgi:DNA-binding MarR family transcriptional regulator
MPARQLDEEELRVWWTFLTLWRDLASGMERQLSDAGSSSADYQVLVTLRETPGRAARPRDIGLQLGWDRSRVSHQLRRMEQRGLVSRAEVAGDARGTMVQLTSEGLQALRATAPGHVAWVRKNFLSQLSDEEARVLTRVGERVIDHLQRPED